MRAVALDAQVEIRKRESKMSRKKLGRFRVQGGISADGSYPEICILDGSGPGGGSNLCAINGFRYADVDPKGTTTEVSFEGGARIIIFDAIVRLNCDKKALRGLYD